MLFLVLLNFYKLIKLLSKFFFFNLLSREDYAIENEGDEDGVGVMRKEVSETY